MEARTRLLKQLVAESLYAVPETEVADAILARATAKRTLPGAGFRSDDTGPAKRSFRRARSFRLSGRHHMSH